MVNERGVVRHALGTGRGRVGRWGCLGIASILLCGSVGCSPARLRQEVVGLPHERTIEVPAPGSECNGVVSCHHPLRGGCMLIIKLSRPSDGAAPHAIHGQVRSTISPVQRGSGELAAAISAGVEFFREAVVAVVT